MKVAVELLSSFKTKCLPHGENVRTCVGINREHDIIFIKHFCVTKIENISGRDVIRKGEKYALVSWKYQIRKSTLLKITELVTNLK